jgi:hypothetical protein
MAERTVLVCDVCGGLEAETITINVDSRKALKDLCPVHLGELMDGSRRPKRGRKPGSKNSTSVKKRSTSTRTKPKLTTKRRRRTRRAATPEASPSA